MLEEAVNIFFCESLRISVAVVVFPYELINVFCVT